MRVNGNDIHHKHPSSSTYINEIRQVMNVILEDRCIRCFQSQQIFISCLNSLQPIFCVLCLALEEKPTTECILKRGTAATGAFLVTPTRARIPSRSHPAHALLFTWAAPKSIPK